MFRDYPGTAATTPGRNHPCHTAAAHRLASRHAAAPAYGPSHGAPGGDPPYKGLVDGQTSPGHERRRWTG